MNKLDIFMGIVLLKTKIAAHTYHLKIQSSDFLQQGNTAEFFFSNPYYDPQSKVHQYPFWNYEPVYHTADFAVHTFSEETSQWIKAVQEGDTVFFRQISDASEADETGEHYFLIGDVTSLSRLYEINRTLSVSKTVSSLIYAEQDEELFPDLDHSFPLNFFISKPVKPEKVIEHIRYHFPENAKNTIAYILGNASVTEVVSRYIRKDPSFRILKIY
ncbi:MULTISPECIES: hypothetical protein [Chryseobacterium]|uniref:hypothetical protein n=1 Tax=Chryseobacterium TaxID=59732 RepID=UPI00129569BE|nr:MULTISPECIES: hypothetical protein [Chryseobacterium]MDR6922615.1 hypothetical protein [Chryseobacterium sp. 2987]